MQSVKKLQFVFLLVCFLSQRLVFAEETGGLVKLSGHVFAYVDIKDASPAANSFGANSGVVIGDDAVLVVDTRISAKNVK